MKFRFDHVGVYVYIFGVSRSALKLHAMGYQNDDVTKDGMKNMKVSVVSGYNHFGNWDQNTFLTKSA